MMQGPGAPALTRDLPGFITYTMHDALRCVVVLACTDETRQGNAAPSMRRTFCSNIRHSCACSEPNLPLVVLGACFGSGRVDAWVELLCMHAKK